MTAIKAILREIFGLFVDDAGFAASILAWLAVVWVAAARLDLSSSPWTGVVLFAGLAAILIESTLRRAGR